MRRNYIERGGKRLYYTLSELERITGINRGKIYTLEKAGFVKPKVLNGRRLYGPDALEKLLNFKVLSHHYSSDAIVSSYEELKLVAKLKRYENALMIIRNRIRRFLKEHGG